MGIKGERVKKDAAIIIRVIVIHVIDARDKLKFLTTLLKASLKLLIVILKLFMFKCSFLIIFY